VVIVRRYYRARSQVPAVMGPIWGPVCTGCPRRGAARFGTYPDLVADDLFVDQYFGHDGIDIVGDDPVVVMARPDYRDLLKVMRHTYRGEAETQVASEGSATRASVSRSTTPTTFRDVLRLRHSPSGFGNAVAHAFVGFSARAYIAFGRSSRWERDESSRTVTATRQVAGTAS
jgi:hypothetical protein